MAFLRSSLTMENAPEVIGRDVVLRPPAMNDYAAWFALRSASRDHLVPFEPQWAIDELSRASFRRRLRQHVSDHNGDLGYAFFIWCRRDASLMGGITLSNVRRGVAHAASLGYWVGQRHARQGVMTDAMRCLLPFAFGNLGLHRLEAACLPGNRPSIRVLEKAGFQPEGLARGYLRINGQWQDHLLFARLQDDPPLATAGTT